MNCQPPTSPLPGIWVVETLARSTEVDISLLLELLQKSPQASDDLGRYARELVSFRILEKFLFWGAQSISISSSSSPKISFDLSDSCEDVLRQILRETPALNLKAAGPEMWKWDFQSFIAHKRSSFDNNALLQLKDAILTGRHSFAAYFKERSGLSFENRPRSGPIAEEGKGNVIADGYEGTTNTNNSHLLHSDLPNENLLLVKRKKNATTKNVRGKSCKDHITSKNGFENHPKNVKENGIIQCEQDFGRSSLSSGVLEQIADKTAIIAQHSERERCSLVRNIHVAEIGLSGPSETDNNERISLKYHGSPNEVLLPEKQAPYGDSKLANDNPDDQHGLENVIREANGDKEGFCDPKCTEKLNNVEPHINTNVHNGNDFGDTHCKHTRYSSATNCRDVNALADICGKFVESNEVPQQSRLPGDVNNEFTSSKGLIGHENVMSHEKQVCHDGINSPIKNFDEERGQNHGDENVIDKGSNELKTTSGYKDRFEKESHSNVPDPGQADNSDISRNSDEYLDEGSDIATKKNAFLSSQCTFTQSDISTQVCVKCNRGGTLLVCSTNSCPLVIHESCSGSQASFGAPGEFYCPFCAYSRAISKYMDAKKKISVTRKDLANFVGVESRKVLKRQPCRSDRVNKHHLEHDDGLHNSELNNQDIAEHSNSYQVKRKLEYVKSLSSGDNHSSSGKTVDSANAKPHPLNNDEKRRKNKEQILKSKESEKNAEIGSKKGVLRSSKTHVPHECKSLLHFDSADARERSEEVNGNSGASKPFMRVQKHQRQYAYQEIPQFRRKRLPWTTAEEEKLKEGMRLLCSPHDRVVQWKKILDFGAGVFQESRSTMDLKDKWRNLCKASPKS